RHAVQLYEAIAYLLIFMVIYPVYWKTNKRKKPGYIFGLFLVLVFGARFVLEYFKEDLGGVESYFGNILSTGQILSVPLILLGLYLMFRKNKNR
ncbi:MAG TPA: prolipoprotein diacylglyceryl transferase, partial [Saprospiraceae bacterium]|nr:prolipoprotein diacylglyceryl transferase [Saprospiraceae bacterium]